MFESRHCRVLVADDNEPLRLIARVVLDHEGFEVIEACDGQEAVERALHAAPAVVVMDVQMPRKDGIAALAEIKHALPDTRVVVWSAQELDEIVTRALVAGADEVVSKCERPPDALVEAVKRCARSIQPASA